MGKSKDSDDTMVWRKKSKLMADALRQIISAEQPQLKVEKAKEYLRDIKSFRDIIPASTKVISRKDLDRIIIEADFVEVEETEYICFATVQTFPSTKSRKYAWMAPLSYFVS